MRIRGQGRDGQDFDEVVHVHGLLVERQVVRVLVMRTGETEARALRLDRIAWAEVID